MSPTLLLADDSVTIRRVIELTFADENITIVAVSNGDEAIARIEAAPPDIVLADTGMPGRSGYDVAEHMRRSPRLAHIPVILLTGAFEAVDQARIGRIGCAGVVAKPFEPQLVIARVNELLSRSWGPPSGGPIRLKPDPTDYEPPLTRSQPKAALDSAALDSYFDRLYSAFSNPSGTPTAEIDSSHAVSEDSKEPQMTNPMPPLADAFAALLAAEQREPLSAVPSSWPAAGGPADSQALVDEATRRVLEQLSDKAAVRETVTKVVSQAAEKLVREELDKIKGSIK